MGRARQVYCRQECLNSQIQGVPKCVYEEVMDCRHSIKHGPADQWHRGERWMANLSGLSHLSPHQHGDLGHGMVGRGLGRGEGVWKAG